MPKHADSFLALAHEFNEQLIREAGSIDSFLDRLLTDTGGRVIIDFLDTANWDYFESYKFDQKTRELILVWRDYRKRTRDRSLPTVFPGDYYALFLKVQSIYVLGNGKWGIVILNGYALTDKDLKKRWTGGAPTIDLRHNSFFETTVYRDLGEDGWDVIQCHTTPLYTVAILPKGIGASNWRASSLLYIHNVDEATKKLRSVLFSLQKADDGEINLICEKMNTARRAFENLLKIECAYYSLTPKASYSKLTIGDLTSLLKAKKSNDEMRIVNQVERDIHSYSHDSGTPVIRGRALLTVALTLVHAEIFASNIRIDMHSTF